MPLTINGESYGLFKKSKCKTKDCKGISLHHVLCCKCRRAKKTSESLSRGAYKKFKENRKDEKYREWFRNQYG